jgi:hypothetical protein
MNFMNLKALSYKICELIHGPVGPTGDLRIHVQSVRSQTCVCVYTHILHNIETLAGLKKKEKKKKGKKALKAACQVKL